MPREKEDPAAAVENPPTEEDFRGGHAGVRRGIASRAQHTALEDENPPREQDFLMSRGEIDDEDPPRLD